MNAYKSWLQTDSLTQVLRYGYVLWYCCVLRARLGFLMQRTDKQNNDQKLKIFRKV